MVTHQVAVWRTKEETGPMNEGSNVTKTTPGDPIVLPGLKGRTAVVTGAGGAIGGAIAEGLAHAGARVAVWDINREAATARAASIAETASAEAIAVECDATDEESIRRALEETSATWDSVDFLVNSAGGSHPSTTTSKDLQFFDIARADLDRVLALNYHTSVLPCQALGRLFAEQGRGVVLNIASIAGLGPLTHSVAYCNGKAATVSFTQWLAVHMAQEYSPAIRVNALAPGFCLTTQNRFLLVDEATGRPTLRCERALAQTPMRRLGRPEEMVGAALWLLSDAASFVTGVVVPVDGGFSAYSGV